MLRRKFRSKMPLSQLSIVLVAALSLTVTEALPVTETTKTPHETDTKQTGTFVEVNTLKIGIGESEVSNGEILKSQQTNFTGNVGNGDETSEPQPCTIANVTYQHREQIPRSDPCEMCVCVDAQMYCFWKICTSHGSATTTVAMTPSEMSNSHHQTLIDKLSEEDEKLNEIVEINEKYSKILTDQRKFNILKKMETTSVRSVGTSEETSPPTTTTTTKTTTTTTTTSTTEPVVCYVMGVTYKYGEVLPRDTGTCLECSCSDGGRVTCSPKDCVSQPDLDYLSHNNNMDMFDIDTF